jgi:hypothetical protein
LRVALRWSRRAQSCDEHLLTSKQSPKLCCRRKNFTADSMTVALLPAI